MPDAGSTLIGVANPKEAKEMANTLADKRRQVELSKTIKISSGDDFLSFITDGKMKNLPIVLKADSQGTLQAIVDSLEGIEHEEVKVNIVSKGVGGITETDLSFSSNTSNTIIIGFNVRPTGSIKRKADNNGVVIKTYSIIYQLIDEVKNLLSGLITPIINTENTGQALVKSVFQIPKIGAVAGCVVEDGKVIKGGLCRVIRDGVVIHDNNTITSLKRFEDDVKEVKNGYECGIMINNYNKIQENDVIETYIQTEETITL
jgi:translation initiation factor IF-2